MNLISELMKSQEVTVNLQAKSEIKALESVATIGALTKVVKSLAKENKETASSLNTVVSLLKNPEKGGPGGSNYIG